MIRSHSARAGYYPIPRATNLLTAIALAGKLCRCVRKSFAGVRWVEGGEERRLTWAEVDGA